MMLLTKLPFALHAAMETAAALSFILTPEKQLPGCSPATKLVLQQYGGLLLSTNFICLVVLLQPEFDGFSKMIGAALGSYHIWPSFRAYARLSQQIPSDSNDASTLGGPVVHLMLHGLCLIMFIYAVIV
ncbi:hypothetical protein BJ170DRAFT_290765 [Xylariales sp. AK1849]|nr:hypothetical protein BJ170DRAFT_290765 [Xylariales sp. AK1849]